VLFLTRGRRSLLRILLLASVGGTRRCANRRKGSYGSGATKTGSRTGRSGPLSASSCGISPRSRSRSERPRFAQRSRPRPGQAGRCSRFARRSRGRGGLRPADPRLLSNLALTLRATDRLNRAVAVMRSACALMPADGTCTAILARCCPRPATTIPPKESWYEPSSWRPRTLRIIRRSAGRSPNASA
jgi:hypothetical protein